MDTLGDNCDTRDSFPSIALSDSQQSHWTESSILQERQPDSPEEGERRMSGDSGRTAYDAYKQRNQARVSIESVGSEDMHALHDMEQHALSAVKRARHT